MANRRLYIVERLHKRRKLSSKQEVDDFRDELLVEVLCRLSHSKHVIQCKCICKRWSALISESYFVGRFIACKKMERPSFVVVARNTYQESWKGLMMHFENKLFNFNSFSLSSLPCVSGDNVTTTVTVVGAYNDLLLYRGVASDRYYYYIYNIQTKQWLSLPSTPFYYGLNIDNAFFCDPYYTIDGDRVIFNAAYRFSIVVAHCPSRRKVASKHIVHIFSSNSRRWTTKVLLLPKSCRLMSYHDRSFVFAGKLHIRSIEGLIAFDPCESGNDVDDVIKCRLIDWPPTMFIVSACVSVHQGELRFYKFDDDHIFTTWVLKDYERGEWSLLHSIASYQWVLPRDCNFVLPQQNNRWWGGFVVAQHPTNPDIVYISPFNWKTMCSILMCDTSTRTVRLVSHLPESMILDCIFTSYSLTLPIWPTPLPTLV